MNRALPLLVLIAALALVAGCERIAPCAPCPTGAGRLRPDGQNTSYEPGIEEEATRQIQAAFLQDGRVPSRPSQRRSLRARRNQPLTPRASGTSGDDITDRTEYTVGAKVELFEPYGEQPLATLPPILVKLSFNTDARSIDYDQLPDRIDSLLKQVANQVVQQTLTGFPAAAR